MCVAVVIAVKQMRDVCWLADSERFSKARVWRSDVVDGGDGCGARFCVVLLLADGDEVAASVCQRDYECRTC